MSYTILFLLIHFNFASFTAISRLIFSSSKRTLFKLLIKITSTFYLIFVTKKRQTESRNITFLSSVHRCISHMFLSQNMLLPKSCVSLNKMVSTPSHIDIFHIGQSLVNFLFNCSMQIY